jgi:deazaflavin-dependent oxidoreductase (nitroreductase family)
LSWLLGKRFILLNHIGRKSGQVHQTVVEVVAHDPASDTYYIVSGWGPKAQWYQNLLAHPLIDVQVGRRKVSVRAETLSPEAGAQRLLEYRHDHPLAARELSRLMGIDINQATPEKLQEIVRHSLPVVALHVQVQS